MAFTTSRYLKLRLDSGLTANSRYNLERIDLLGSVLTIDTRDITNLRSRSDLVIEPQAAASGGSGLGGIVSIGTNSHTIAELHIYADSLILSAPLPLESGGTGQTTAVDAINALLPSQTGNAGLVLQTDGNNVSWEAAGSGVLAFETDWSPGDGTSKSVVHNLANSDLTYAVRDTGTGEFIYIDKATAIDDNTVNLISSEVPASTWRVLIQASP